MNVSLENIVEKNDPAQRTPRVERKKGLGSRGI